MNRKTSALVGTLGIALLFIGMAMVSANPTSADDLVARAYVPLLAGDDATGNGALATSTPIPGGCAGPRSAVRTLSDSDAGFEREPVASSLIALLDEQAPSSAGTARISPLESGVVRIEAYLQGLQSGPGQSLELLLANAPGDFNVVAGMPHGQCTNEASSSDKATLAQVRVAYQTTCGTKTGPRTPVAVVIEAVPHWSLGPNGPQISLWPILDFQLADGWTCAGVAPTATATPTVVPPIDVLYLSVEPQIVAPGGTVHLTARAEPPGPGHVCTPSFSEFSPPAGLQPVETTGTEPALTGADGKVSWDVAIPANTAIGLGRFQVNCDNKGGQRGKDYRR